MVAILQQLFALTQNTGILTILKIKLLRRCWPEILPDEEEIAEQRSRRLIQATCDNVAELVTPLVLGIAILSETMYVALGGPETFYDQGIFRHWRKGVSVPQTFVALVLVTVLRVLFLRLELRVSQYLSDVREKAEMRKVKPEDSSNVAPVMRMTAIDEWKAVLVRIHESSYYAKVMMAAGILVNIVLLITESAWYAYYVVVESEQDDTSTD